MITAKSVIRDRFFPYQLRWLEDRSPFKIGLWARQTGKDYTCAAEAVFDCYRRQTRWLIVAASERQAIESLEKAKTWAETFREIIALHSNGATPRPIVCHASEIRFSNGSRITALPGKPATVRGYSANIILTEFAFHENPEAIWRALFPSASNSLQGGQKKVRVITTPNGQGNFFHQLWHHSTLFSRHRVTIHDATAQGLPLDIATLRAGLSDPDAWAQEYECQFLDGSCVLLPYELIDSCESSDATETSTPQILSTHTGELFVGIDFGRKQDLTVCWILEKVPAPALCANSLTNEKCSVPNAESLFITREVLTLERMTTPEQLTILRPRVARARRVCIDYTGAGVGLGDLLMAEFGNSSVGVKYTHNLAPPLSGHGKLELCSFTNALKNELFPSLRAAFERRRLLIPANPAIREDLHGVHKFITQHGHITYRATHTSDGHSDRCTALALALRAAETAPPTTCASTIDIPRLRRI